MPTHPIGKGTVTLSINIPAAERAILGRLSCAEDRSIGDVIKRALVVGLRDTHPEAADEIAAIRERHRAARAGVTLSAVLLAVGLQFGGHSIAARPAPMRRGAARVANGRFAARQEVAA